jgi:hypothetical protein
MTCSKAYTTQQTSRPNCPDKFGCIPGVCPDFTIRRHDTKPPFKVLVDDCDGPLDLTDLVLEASMWANAKLKANLSTTDDYFALADNIGFGQAMVGDIIIMDRTRMPEHMLVIAFDEKNKLIQVQRGYHGTQISEWNKGDSLRIFRFMGATGETEMVLRDILQLDGTTAEDQLTESFLVYSWGENDTCLPGCYYLEFKLLKMTEVEAMTLATTTEPIVPSFTDPNLTPASFGCGLGAGVEWVRRFPVSGEGFLIQIVDSPTAEF